MKTRSKPLESNLQNVFKTLGSKPLDKETCGFARDKCTSKNNGSILRSEWAFRTSWANGESNCSNRV